MPRILIDNEEGSIVPRRKNRTKNKRGRRRHHRVPNTERTTGVHHLTPNVQDVEPQQLLTENDVFVDLENLDGDNIAHYFMTKDDTDPKLEGQAKTVVLFCHPDALSELQSGSSKLLLEKVCLIDDRTCQGLTSRALGVCKPLGVYDMFKKLQEKRFSETEPSVHRRLIFITDLNSHSLAALMATTPPSHVDALITFFYSHIALHSHLGISSRSRGLPTFTHSFHLPFYSWKRDTRPPLDPRRKQDNSRLRKFHDMSFLRGIAMPRGQATDYLCEAQVSVMITAINQTVWTGYCFVDTYHELGERRKTVENYCKSELDPDQVQQDPFVEDESENPILDPGEYFLTSLDCQLKVFKSEWMQTNRLFTERVEEYIDHFEHEAQGLPERSPQARQEPLVWLRRTRRILTDLISCLELTISCWDNYPFQGQFETEYSQRCLRSIQQSFVESKKCLKELESIRTRCDDHKETLSLYSIDTHNRIAELQAKAAQNAQTISYFVIYILSPATIAAAMLSMQEKAIPTILGPTKLSFFILTPFLTLALYAMSWMIRSWEKIQQLFVHLRKLQDVLQPETIELEGVV